MRFLVLFLVLLIILTSGCVQTQMLDSISEDSSSDDSSVSVGGDSNSITEGSEYDDVLNGLYDLDLVTTAYAWAETDINLSLEACFRVDDVNYKENCYKNLPKAIFTGQSFVSKMYVDSATSDKIILLFDLCTNQLQEGVDYSNFKGNTGTAGCLDITNNIADVIPKYVEVMGASTVLDILCNDEGMNEAETCTSLVSEATSES